MREQIADLLAQGYKAVQVASMCSCSEAHISELLKEESFRETLRTKMREHVGVRLTSRYDALEENVLKELNDSIANCDAGDLVRVLEGIARIKNANKVAHPVNPFNNPTLGITLVFPQQNIPRLVTDDSNRVVAIGEKTMLPMPAKAVRKMFEQFTKDNEDANLTIEQLAAR